MNTPREEGSNFDYYVSEALFEKDMRLIKQVEYYFSDENLPGDDFLFNKIMHRDSTSWVPIHVLNTFPKIKLLNFSNADISWAVNRYSRNLRVDRVKLLIKRIRPLRRYLQDETRTLSRSLKIENISVSASASELEALFSQFGNLRCVRIINCVKDKAVEKPYAVAEYDSEHQAIQAMKNIRTSTNWRNGLKVTHLLNSPAKGNGAALQKENFKKALLDGPKQKLFKPNISANAWRKPLQVFNS